MRTAHLVADVRAAEADAMAALPDGTLMQRAAHGLSVAIADALGVVYGARVLLLIGSGDNGADALYAGAKLARRGAGVEAILLGSSTHQAALAEFVAAGGRVVATGEEHPPDVVVDGIVGIGGRPGLRPEAAEVVARHREAFTVAVDVPSGVGVDDGAVDGPHVVADLTLTFGTHKMCHFLDPAAAACGVVELVDIGLDLPSPALEALQPEDIDLAAPAGDSHKYTRGVVGIRAGSAAYPGAAVLCAAGASSGLAGMVRYDGPAADLVQAAHPGVVRGAGRVQAWVVGPGTDDTAATALERSLADGVPVVVDADALAHLPEPMPVPAVLTPHAGELAAMLGIGRDAVESDPLRWGREAARRWQATVVVKGRHTVVVAADGPARVNTTGTPWLAAAGTGDVLAGLIGALLASGYPPLEAASIGAWLHGASANLIGGPLTPEGVADGIPEVVRSLAWPR